MEVRVRRNDCASRIVNSFTRQVPSKATLLSFQSLYKSSGSFFGLVKIDKNEKLQLYHLTNGTMNWLFEIDCLMS